MEERPEHNLDERFDYRVWKSLTWLTWLKWRAWPVSCVGVAALRMTLGRQASGACLTWS